MGSHTQPRNGTCVPQLIGILYTPETGFCGVDSFNYTVTEPSGRITTATVTVDVECSHSNATEEITEIEPESELTNETDRLAADDDEVDDDEVDYYEVDTPVNITEVTDPAVTSGPLIANDDFYTTDQGSSVVLFVLANDTFPDGK